MNRMTHVCAVLLSLVLGLVAATYLPGYGYYGYNNVIPAVYKSPLIGVTYAQLPTIHQTYQPYPYAFQQVWPTTTYHAYQAPCANAFSTTYHQVFRAPQSFKTLGANKTEHVFKAQFKPFQPFWSYEGSIQHLSKDKKEEKMNVAENAKEVEGKSIEREETEKEMTTASTPTTQSSKEDSQES